VHGLLLSQKMHRPLAKALVARGDRVMTLDLLGHGRSERPRDMTLYSMPFFGEQILGLLDHLVAELPDARLVRAESFLELRLTPERLTDEIAAFLDECWTPRAAAMARRSPRVS
jgi:hypothetical protein